MDVFGLQAFHYGLALRFGNLGKTCLQESWAFGFGGCDRSGRIGMCTFEPDGNGRFLRLQELVRGSDDANKIRIVLRALGTVMALENVNEGRHEVPSDCHPAP